MTKTTRIAKLNALSPVSHCCELVASYFPSPLPNQIKQEIERLCKLGVSELDIVNFLFRQYFRSRTHDVEALHDAIADELCSSSPNPDVVSSFRAIALSYAYNEEAWQTLLEQALQKLRLGEFEVFLLFSEFLSGRVKNITQAEAWNAHRLEKNMKLE